jgi:hypothetical protein
MILAYVENGRLEQYVYVKFCLKLGINDAETLEMVEIGSGERTM